MILCIPQPEKTSQPGYEAADIMVRNQDTVSQEINFELLQNSRKSSEMLSLRVGQIDDKAYLANYLATLHVQYPMVTDLTGVSTQLAS